VMERIETLLLDIPHLVNGDVPVADVIDSWAARICAIPKDEVSEAYDALDTGYDPNENGRVQDVRTGILSVLRVYRDGHDLDAYDRPFTYPGDTEYDRIRAALRRYFSVVVADDRSLHWSKPCLP
jgi:hypothetical protein